MIGSKLTPHVVISALNQYTTTKILSNPLSLYSTIRKRRFKLAASADHDRQREYFELGHVHLQHVFNSISYQNRALF